MFPFFRQRRLPGWFAVCPRDNGIEMAHIVRDGEAVALSAWAFVPGEQKDSWAFLAELAEDKTRNLRSYQCTTLLPNGSYQLIQVEAPDVPAAEQKEALRWRLKDMIEYPVETVSFDILPLPEKVQPGRTPQLYAAVARNEVIQPVVKGFHAAGLQLEVIDVPELAQRNVATLFEDENRALAFLAFDDHSALLTFNYQGEMFSLRRIDVGARQFIEANEDRRAQLAERIVLELQRSIDAVDRQFSAISLSRMIVALPPECGLEQYLSNNLYIPFEAMDLGKVMDLSAVPEMQSLEAQRQALKVIGAALRHEEVAA